MAPRRPNPPLSRLVPHLIGVLTAAHLGLLSPAICVITCALQDMLAPVPATLLCGGTLPVVASPDLPSDVPPALTPRALYELASLSAVLLAIAGGPGATIVPRPRPVVLVVAPTPLTPPPRPALA